ncbi:hypothetical protein CASFOL_004368 [Castilleja foliolosa]|uniref:Uncharacterized protein n=1 Tax=Castilleja foliolosa TaxID=1961234 RepID=A0ABD3EAD6_9LAMI
MLHAVNPARIASNSASREFTALLSNMVSTNPCTRCFTLFEDPLTFSEYSPPFGSEHSKILLVSLYRLKDEDNFRPLLV